MVIYVLLKVVFADIIINSFEVPQNIDIEDQDAVFNYYKIHRRQDLYDYPEVVIQNPDDEQDPDEEEEEEVFVPDDEQEEEIVFDFTGPINPKRR